MKIGEISFLEEEADHIWDGVYPPDPDFPGLVEVAPAEALWQ
ncbi:hypothetical protein [Nocardia sp. bgisy134]